MPMDCSDETEDEFEGVVEFIPPRPNARTIDFLPPRNTCIREPKKKVIKVARVIVDQPVDDSIAEEPAGDAISIADEPQIEPRLSWNDVKALDQMFLFQQQTSTFLRFVSLYEYCAYNAFAALVAGFDKRSNILHKKTIPAHTLPAVTTITAEHAVTPKTSIENLPAVTPRSRKSGKRGKDRRPRCGRKCKACTACNGKGASNCRGRGGAMLCRNFCSLCVDTMKCEAASRCPGRLDRSQCNHGRKRRVG